MANIRHKEAESGIIKIANLKPFIPTGNKNTIATKMCKKKNRETISQTKIWPKMNNKQIKYDKNGNHIKIKKGSYLPTKKEKERITEYYSLGALKKNKKILLYAILTTNNVSQEIYNDGTTKGFENEKVNINMLPAIMSRKASYLLKKVNLLADSLSPAKKAKLLAEVTKAFKI